MKISLLLMCIVILSGCGGDLGSGKHTSPPATVLEVKECYGGDGFFGGVRTCPIKVKWTHTGEVVYAETWDSVWVGQTVYRECWSDGCFSKFTHSPRKMYRNNK